MDHLIMTANFWPFFLALTGLTMAWLLRFSLNGGVSAPQSLIGSPEKTGFETEYLLGHISSYTLRMVKVD